MVLSLVTGRRSNTSKIPQELVELFQRSISQRNGVILRNPLLMESSSIPPWIESMDPGERSS